MSDNIKTVPLAEWQTSLKEHWHNGNMDNIYSIMPKEWHWTIYKWGQAPTPKSAELTDIYKAIVTVAKENGFKKKRLRVVGRIPLVLPKAPEDMPWGVETELLAVGDSLVRYAKVWALYSLGFDLEKNNFVVKDPLCYFDRISFWDTENVYVPISLWNHALLSGCGSMYDPSTKAILEIALLLEDEIAIAFFSRVVELDLQSLEVAF